MPLILITTDRVADHLPPPGHPESPERAEVMGVIAREWRARGGEVVAPPEVSREQLLRVHDDAYLKTIENTAGRSVALDPDTYTSPESHEIALLAAGAAVDGVERALDGRYQRAFALVRPPGHHAERDRAMGFCLYNNVAVAAAHARARGARRVAIVDYDVHHGNGTQHAFDADAAVLYVSLHQWPFYPGTGGVEDVGTGPAAGRTVNLPLEAGAGDDDYRMAFVEIVVPVLRRFEPSLLLVSAGFDAHERDPLASMRLTTPAFGAMTAELRQVADESCGGRIVAVTEGGYDLRALAGSMRAVIQALEPEVTPVPAWPACDIEPSRGRRAVLAVRRALEPYRAL